MSIEKWRLNQRVVSLVEKSFNIDNHVKLETNQSKLVYTAQYEGYQSKYYHVQFLDSEYLIKDRNPFPSNWKSFHIERSVKLNLYDQNKSIELERYDTINQMENAIEKVKKILNVPALNRNTFINLESEQYSDEKNEMMIEILDSVLYTQLYMNRKHKYDGCDDGMGLYENSKCQGTLMTSNGKLIEFSFYLNCSIVGGHSDGYTKDRDSHIQLGNYYLRMKTHIYEDDDEQNYQEFLENVSKLFNDDGDSCLCPSGLRGCIKAAISSDARVQIPLNTIFIAPIQKKSFD
eukprot:gene7936-9762_t